MGESTFECEKKPKTENAPGENRLPPNPFYVESTSGIGLLMGEGRREEGHIDGESMMAARGGIKE